jgi:hypothetical protein
MSREDVLKNAKRAKAQLSEIANPVPFFHIRPTSSGITFVTTHKDRAMRGIAKISAARTGEMLTLASRSIKGAAVDFSRVKYVRKTGRTEIFEERTQASLSKKREKEFAIQAFVINAIVSGEKSLPDKFGVDRLFFMGSELILQDGTVNSGQRIDIVAHDGNGKILFIELKDESTKDDPCDQMRKYLKKYGNDEQFKELLLNYPSIPGISKVDRPFEGWVIVGDCNDLNIGKLKITKV